MPPISRERWGLVRRLYEQATLKVAEIALVAGLVEATIYRRAKQEGWRRRRGEPVGLPADAATPAEAPAGVPTAMPGGRADIARRLWLALDRHLQDLESAGVHAGDGRAGQALATLTRTVEKLIEVERDLQEERTSEHAGVDGPEDVDVGALLAELAGRIEALA